MKRHFSVLLLMVRSSIYRVLALLGLLTLTETGIFVYLLQKGPTDRGFGPELLLEQGGIGWVFAAAMAAMTVLLCRIGMEGKTKTGYTLRRLSVSERWVFVWQSVCNTLCYLLLWLWQILTAMLLCLLYVRLAPQEYVTGQTVVLAFYRSGFLHSLLPFEEGVVWAKVGFMVLALGICSARWPLGQRRGSKVQEITGACLGAIAFFQDDIGSVPGVISILLSMVLIGVSVYRALDREESYEVEKT